MSPHVRRIIELTAVDQADALAIEREMLGTIRDLKEGDTLDDIPPARFATLAIREARILDNIRRGQRP